PGCRPALGGYRFGGPRPGAGHLAVEAEFVAQPDAVAERAPGHVPDHLPHEHSEFFRIDVHSSLHFLAERPSSPAGAAWQTVRPRETSLAAPVRCSAWFGAAPLAHEADPRA